MLKLSREEITGRNAACTRLPVCAVLNNIRSLYNVGSIFRTADAAGLEKLWLTGITGCPPQSKIAKTALGAEKNVPWEHRWNAEEVLRELKSRGYQIVLVEQTRESRNYDALDWKFPVCLVFGNENTGVSDELLSLADTAAEIEMAGLKHSLNVTVAFGVIAYHLRKIFVSRIR